MTFKNNTNLQPLARKELETELGENYSISKVMHWDLFQRKTSCLPQWNIQSCVHDKPFPRQRLHWSTSNGKLERNDLKELSASRGTCFLLQLVPGLSLTIVPPLRRNQASLVHKHFARTHETMSGGSGHTVSLFGFQRSLRTGCFQLCFRVLFPGSLDGFIWKILQEVTRLL